MSQLSREDFVAKIDWEGGSDAAIEYGLSPEDCADPRTAAWWRECLKAHSLTPTMDRDLEEIREQIRTGKGAYKDGLSR